jgi:superoxide dismutase, Cu-Zn family
MMNRHVGDLGNLTTDSTGMVTVNISDSIIQFYNMNQSIANRTIVVHELFDDGGLGTGLSNTTG